MKKNKNEYIQITRAILIICIMFYHYTYRFSEIYGGSFSSINILSKLGIIGVNCFFVISGLFIFSKKEHNDFKFFEYLKKKISNLWPLYAICMTITFVLLNLFKLPYRTTNLIEYFTNLIFVNGFINVNYVDGAYWYLKYLLISFVIFGIIQKIISISKGKKIQLNKNILILLYLIIINILFMFSKNNNIIKFIFDLMGNIYIVSIILGILLMDFKFTKNITTLLLILLNIISIFFLQGKTIAFVLVFFAIYLYIILSLKERKSRFYMCW